MNNLRKAVDQVLKTWDGDDWFDADTLRAALAIPELPLSTGGWDCSEDGKQIFHDDFEFDAKLKVSGDFATDEQRIEFARMVTKTLNGALTQHEQEPLCDKDPRGCWSVRCQLGKVCKKAQPEQEPIAWLNKNGAYPVFLMGTKQQIEGMVPLYTAPPQRKPLTDDQIAEIQKSCFEDVLSAMRKTQSTFAVFARAIERSHGIV